MILSINIYALKKHYHPINNKLIPYIPIIFTFLLFSLSSKAQISDGSSNEKLMETPQILDKPIPVPTWLGKEPIVFIGNWDDDPLFQRRRGGNAVFQEEVYAKGHTEEAVQKLKEVGITMAIIHFYKGFGIEAEKKQMKDAKKLASLYHKYGIKVGVYIASTVSFETMLLENPEAEEWFVPDYLGQPVIYHSQTFRKRVYFMHPGYIKHIKEVIRIAIEDLKVDLIHFDNTSMQAQHPIFFHPMAIEDFRIYLKNKYSDKMLRKRFGFSDVRYVEPPNYNLPLSKIEDPLFQEWTDFRCEQLANYYSEMKSYIRNLNPEVAIDNNPHSGISGVNSKWLQGVDYPRLLAQTDFVWVEERNEARVSEDSILLSKIRTYKAANILNNRIFTYTGTNPYSPGSELQMAEAMAYNRQCLGMVGGDLAGYKMLDKEKEYVKFYHDNFNYYRDINNIADVAILHSYASMAFNNDEPYQSTYLYEQSLIQAKVPFDIIFDDNLKNLSKYKVLVLADQESLSDEKLDLIKKFVENGGGLIVTGNTSLYNEWRQRKRDFGLRDILPDDVLPSGNFEKTSFKNIVGNGRVVYIPEVIPSIKKPAGSSMTSEYWRLPKNFEVLIESIKWAANEKLSLEIDAPIFITAEVTSSLDQSKYMLHLINYNVENEKLIKDIDVSIKIPQEKKVKEVLLLSPDIDKSEPIVFTVKDNRVFFKVPKLILYDLLAIELF